MKIDEKDNTYISQIEAHSQYVQKTVMKLTNKELLHISPSPKYSSKEYLIKIRKKSLLNLDD